MTNRRVLHAALVVLTAGLLVLWAGSILMLGLTGMLMSVDEEWTGWGDLLLNPFVVGPWLALTGACAASSIALVRHEKDDRISRQDGDSERSQPRMLRRATRSERLSDPGV